MSKNKNIKALKIAIFPSAQQIEDLEFFKYLYKRAYNWYLDNKKFLYIEAGTRYTWQDASNDITALKEQGICPWFIEKLPVELWKSAFKTVDKAFVNMYEGRAGYPRFKKTSHNLKLGFDFSKCHFNDTEQGSVKTRLKGDKPRLYLSLTGIGRVELHLKQTLKYLGLYKPEMRSKHSLTELRDMALDILKNRRKTGLKVSYDGLYWFISFGIEHSVESKPLSGSLGLDLGLKETLAYHKSDTQQEGLVANINTERKLQVLKRRLINTQKKASKFYPKNKGKRRRYKKHGTLKRLEYAIKLLHRKMNNIRKERVYGIVKTLLELRPQVVVVETLKIKQLMSNSKLGASFQKQALGNILRIIEYQTYFMGGEFRQANQWYASSKLCSACGHKHPDLKLSDRVYHCSNCGMVIDRDINAARNLSNLGFVADGDLVKTKVYGEKQGKKGINQSKPRKKRSKKVA